MATATGPTKRGRLLSFWQFIGGESNITRNFNRELLATTEETDKSPISITTAHPNEGKLSDVQVIEVDLTTTEDMGSGQEICAIEPPKTSNGSKEQKLQRQQTEESLDNLSKLFDESILAERTSEDTRINHLRPVIERGDKPGFELMGPYTIPLWSQMAAQDDCILVNNRLAVPLQLRQAVLK